MPRQEAPITTVVKEAIAEGLTAREIPDAKKLSRNAVSRTLGNLRRARPELNNTPFQTQLLRAESQSAAKGGLLLLLKPFARPGRGTAEILREVKRVRGIDVDPKKASVILAKARKSGIIPPLTPEDKFKIQSNGRQKANESRPKSERTDDSSVKQLVERGATIEDVMELMNYERAQVNRSLKRIAKRNEFKYFDEEERVKRRKAAARRGHQKNAEDPDREQAVKFARQLIKNGFLKADLDARLMAERVVGKEPVWEKGFAFQFLIEAFIYAGMNQLRDRRSAMARFQEIGWSIDEHWFVSDRMKGLFLTLQERTLAVLKTG